MYLVVLHPARGINSPAFYLNPALRQAEGYLTQPCPAKVCSNVDHC